MILVTGGTGFLGAHLLLELCKNNEKIAAIRRGSSSLDYVKRVFAIYQSEHLFTKIEWREADLLDIFSLDDAFADVHQLYHCAGEVAFTPDKNKEVEALNTEGTANVVAAALEVKGLRMIHVSSIAALGRSRLDDVIDETRTWKNDPNNSKYAISKYNAEREVWRGIEEGLNAAIVNPAVILGYINWNEGTGQMFDKVYKGLKFYTEGVTSYVDVKDVARFMILLMNSDIQAQKYILAVDNVSFKNVFTEMANALGVKPPSIEAKNWMSKIAWRLESIKYKLTGKTPLITKETARNASLKCYYSHKKSLEVFSFVYTPLQVTIQDTASLYLKENKL